MNIEGKTRNVIYQATMGNTVFAWDAITGEELWKTNLGIPITGSKPSNAQHQRQMGNPLHTRDRSRRYVLRLLLDRPDGTGAWQTGRYFVAALDIASGALKPGKPLLPLHGATYDAGTPGTTQTFDSMERKQRAALAIVNGAVIICFGTVQETAKSARGWVIAVDTARWTIAATWCSTARGSGGGIWMSGSGPAIQSDGSIWVVTGNGEFDGQVDFAESESASAIPPPRPGPVDR